MRNRLTVAADDRAAGWGRLLVERPPRRSGAYLAETASHIRQEELAGPYGPMVPAGTDLHLRALDPRRRGAAALGGSLLRDDWWRSVSDEVMSHVANWESRLLQTAAVTNASGALVDVLEPETDLGPLFPRAPTG